MKRISLLALLTLTRLSAAPAISAVMNAASNLEPRLPNSAIAPGSIFIIKGTGLGPTNISVAPAPFQSTALSGTLVEITIGTTKVNPLMYYTSDKQIAALLPSNTPPSTGATSTITVTYNGQTSPVLQFRGVVTNNLSIFTLDSTGQGGAIVTFPDYSLVSALKGTPCGGPNTACGAANPGDTLILWGTGLGAISGNDATGAGLGLNMPDVPLFLWLGGVQVPIVYQGRSGCCIGEDQIVFTVPANVPTGCAVPLIAQIRNQISNSTVMPVAIGSRSCTPADDLGVFTPSATATSLSYADVGLQKGFPNNTPQDSAYYGPFKIGLQPWAAPFLLTFLDDSPPLGTCLVQDDSNPGNEEFGTTGFAALDGGPSITVRGPSGSVNVPYNNGDGSTLGAAGDFLVPGSYTVTGAGGRDVGPFSVTATIPPLPTLTSPVNGATVTRTNNFTFTWTGGGAGVVNFRISNGPDAAPDTRATLRCKAAASAGTLTIPSYLLLALPAGRAGTFRFGFEAPRASFTASGVDVGGLHISIVRSFGGLVLQ